MADLLTFKEATILFIVAPAILLTLAELVNSSPACRGFLNWWRGICDACCGVVSTEKCRVCGKRPIGG